jgi:hypothetical protein
MNSTVACNANEDTRACSNFNQATVGYNMDQHVQELTPRHTLTPTIYRKGVSHS